MQQTNGYNRGLLTQLTLNYLLLLDVSLPHTYPNMHQIISPASQSMHKSKIREERNNLRELWRFITRMIKSKPIKLATHGMVLIKLE